MEQVDLRLRKGKCVLPVIRMAAGIVRIAAAWADLMPPETPKRMTNDELRMTNANRLLIRHS
jgi:hypothetical protein